MQVPSLNRSLRRPKYDWQYLTTNDGVIDQGVKNGSINWPRGKMIGGSSNINAMVYVEGNDQDYQNWHNAGNAEWTVKEVRRCFKKSQNYQNQRLLQDQAIYEHYGHNGPLVINTFNSTYRKVTEKILESWDDIGIKNVPDLNTANVMGSGIMTATAANGERQSSSKAYLQTVQNRTNLKILKNSLVTKILIKGSVKVAYGVQVKRESKIYTYLSKKEVIICAGSINSPQLLMLSGIGNSDHLAAKKIKRIVHSPMVGQNLQDHLIIIIPICNNESNPESIKDQNFDVIKYLYNRTGYLAQNSIADILAFFSASSNATYPDYQSHLIVAWKNLSDFKDILTKLFRFKDSIENPLVELNKNYTMFLFLFNLLHPTTRGNITLRSNNPEDHPYIYPNYLKNHHDLESAANGIKILTSALKTEYFKSIGAFLARMNVPECHKYDLDSRDYWKCVSLNTVQTIYHPVGTCAMGADINTSVVDSRLRVHGVKNLRVIDASVMPTITSGNTNGPTMMIAERGAELLKEDYNK